VVLSCLVAPRMRARRVWRRLRASTRTLQAAWDRHGATDHYLSMREARQIYGLRLPGCRVRRYLAWRYAVVWDKPAGVRSQGVQPRTRTEPRAAARSLPSLALLLRIVGIRRRVGPLPLLVVRHAQCVLDRRLHPLLVPRRKPQPCDVAIPVDHER